MIEPDPLILLAALSLDLLLTAASAGLTNARMTRLLALKEQKEKEVVATLHLLHRRTQMNINLHIAQGLFRFLIAGLVLASFLPWPQAGFPAIQLTLILAATAIVVSFLESLVRSYVLREPETWAMRMALFTRVLLFGLSPVLWLPYLLSRLVISEPENLYNVTEAELNLLLDAGQQEGVLEDEERQMISSIFDFRDTLAREIMVPRIDMLALNVDTTLFQAMEALLQSGYSRVPVYEETIDKIIGVLYVKDLLRLWIGETREMPTLHEILRPAYFVPESKKVDELLTEMQDQHIHIAVAVDEYGGVAGLVTLEDIVEELVGEIQDEYDHAEEQIYQQLDNEEYVFQGRIDLDDFNEIMHTELPTGDAETLGGLIYSRIGRVPKGGETVRADDILLTVEQVTGRRIRKVKARRLSAAEEESELNPHAEG